MQRKHRVRRRVTTMVVVVATMAVALAAGIGSAGASRSAVRGFDGSTITVAGLGIKSQLGGAETGAQARIKRFNDTNEIKGVKIDYTELAEDKNDPATALSEARRLVTQTGIFAMVGEISTVSPVVVRHAAARAGVRRRLRSAVLQPQADDHVVDVRRHRLLLQPGPVVHQRQLQVLLHAREPEVGEEAPEHRDVRSRHDRAARPATTTSRSRPRAPASGSPPSRTRSRRRTRPTTRRTSRRS